MMWMSSGPSPPQNKLHINKTQPRNTPVASPSRFSIQVAHFDFFQYFLGHQVAKHLDFAGAAGLPDYLSGMEIVHPDLDSKKKTGQNAKQERIYTLPPVYPIIQSTQSYKIQKITFGKQKDLRDTL